MYRSTQNLAIPAPITRTRGSCRAADRTRQRAQRRLNNESNLTLNHAPNGELRDDGMEPIRHYQSGQRVCKCGCGTPVKNVWAKAHHITRSRSLEERFWPKVDKAGANGCWLWTAGAFKASNGEYGCFRIGAKSRHAHRVAYELVVGLIPEGLFLDHLCRVTRCVNPAHLEPVTPRENQIRGIGFIGQNARKTHCAKGHPLEGRHLYIAPNGQRGCRTCRTEAMRRYRARKAATA